MVGRKTTLNLDELKTVLKRRKEELFDDEGELRAPSSACWCDVVSDLTNYMEPKYAYVFVKQNRHNIMHILLEKNEVSDVDSTSSSMGDGDEQQKFSITLSSEKWTELYQPDKPIIYESRDRHTLKKK